MLKSTSKFPPGGWKFVQPQTGWHAPPGMTFTQVVDAIVKHRQANPRFNLDTGYDSVAAELEIYTEKRLRAMPGTQDYYVDTGGEPSKKAQAPAHRKSVVAGAVESVKRTVAGIRTLIGWLGSGAKPVERDIAVSRALVCVSCPKNKAGSLRQWLQASAAADIQSLIGIAKDLQLQTPVDDKLEVCQACDCHLPLKVWVPIEHVRKTTSDQVKADLDPNCWMLKEL